MTEDENFGHWLAGFIDGEGCFFIAKVNRPHGYRPRFSLTVRADDSPIVEQASSWSGLGTTHTYRAGTGSKVIRWMIQSQSDCEGLMNLLERYPLRAKKSSDFQVWSQAVRACSAMKLGRGVDNSDLRDNLSSLKQALTESRTSRKDSYS